MKNRRVISFAIAIVINLVIALGCYLVFGDSLGWHLSGRAGHSGLLRYGLPLLQFIAFGYLLDSAWRLLMYRMSVLSMGRHNPPKLGVQLGTFFVYFGIFCAVLSLVFGQSIGGFLAASGVAGLVVGFALRGLVSDLFSGIALNLDHNLAVGDWIEFNHRGRDFSGQLVDIHWRCVVIRDREQNLVLIPNSEITMVTVINRSRPAHATIYQTRIAIGSEHDPNRVMEILVHSLAHTVTSAMTLAEPKPRVEIGSFDAGVVSYRLLYAINPDKIEPAQANTAVLKTGIQFLKAAGIYLYPILPNYGNPDKLPQDRLRSREVRLRVLAAVPLFRVLSAQELEIVADGAELIHKTPGSIVIRAGEPGDCLMVVAEGRLDVIIDSETGPITVGALWPGECVGEVALLTGAARSATVVARETSWLFVVNKPVMAKLLEMNPDLVAVMAVLIERRRGSRDSALRNASASTTVSVQEGTIVNRIRLFFGL